MPAQLTAHLQATFGPHVLGAQTYRGQEMLVLKREGLVPVAQFLRDDPAMAFDFLMDLAGVDYLKFGRSQSSAPTLTTPAPLPYFMQPKPDAEPWQRLVPDEEYRFEVVYHFYSSSKNHRLRVKVPLTAADPSVPSLTGLWRSANWFEREAWDMYGITFTGHPDLRRLLTFEGFPGHPLRKDYPIRRRPSLNERLGGRVGPHNQETLEARGPRLETS